MDTISDRGHSSSSSSYFSCRKHEIGALRHLKDNPEQGKALHTSSDAGNNFATRTHSFDTSVKWDWYGNEQYRKALAAAS